AEELARRAAIVIERRRLEDERGILVEREREARAQAELASRAKDEFLAMVSHELRNPLNAILGWARLLSQRDLPPEVLKHLGTIERNARAQARLVDDVLDVSRIISGKLRLDFGNASIEQAIADAVEAARPIAESKRLTLTTNVEPGIGVRADQVRLQQIIANLISNAVKFTPSGGEVSLDASLFGSLLRVTVRDSGEGIEKALLSTIFEPFRQADGSTTRRHGGLGLGLAIVRRLVEAHGGTVRAESAGKGLGSTFVVELPARSSSEPPFAGPRGDRLTLPELSGLRVLVVDDEADAVELLRALCTDAGATVEVARSAKEVLDKLPGFRPDVVVSDIGMPEMDGYALMRHIRALPETEGGATPAIAVTAYVRREDAQRALASGFQAHVTKPVDPAQLLSVVARVSSLRP
ncbi:MAG TPA: ATP-binding protein, partial [Polyangiaceae bacterium]|nr:ATP-binding protein [Polyangiaceae bacterium]